MAKWNLDDIHKPEEGVALIEELKKKVKEFSEYKEKLNSISKEEFMGVLKLLEEISVLSSRIGSYSMLKLTENTSDSRWIAYDNKVSEIGTMASNEMLFFGLWFKSLPDDKAKELIDASGQYSYFLKHSRLFKDYILSEKEEKLINLKDLSGAEKLTKLYDVITNKFLFEWDGKKITQEELRVYARSHKREERKKAYELLLDRYNEERTALSEIYNGIVTDLKNEDIVMRGFKSPLSVRNLSSDLPDEAVDAMLCVIRKNAQVFHDYFRVKSKILGIKMDRFDLYAPLAEDKTEYDYEMSKEMVLDLYQKFDPEFYSGIKKIFDDSHVHSEKTPNKRSGAFCLQVHGNISPYILLNHMGRLEDLFTMAHELGHGVHYILASDLPELVQHPCLPLAETASTFSEMLLSHKLIKEGGQDLKKKLLMRLLDNQYASIIRQAYFTFFEIDAHKAISEGADSDMLDNLYMENLREQFGDSIQVDERFKNEWLLIPHIFHSPFYCYSYAFGELLVLALYKRYLDDPGFVEEYKKILSAGGSKAPAQILDEAGIDILDEGFWQGGFEIIKDEISELCKLN